MKPKPKTKLEKLENKILRISVKLAPTHGPRPGQVDDALYSSAQAAYHRCDGEDSCGPNHEWKDLVAGSAMACGLYPRLLFECGTWATSTLACKARAALVNRAY